MAVFRHKHEMESGRTSSISQQLLGYDEEGKVRGLKEGRDRGLKEGSECFKRFMRWASSISQQLLGYGEEGKVRGLAGG
jgi:RecB family endonuclease NucS